MAYPLFVVTGVSGSGKSTTAVELKRIMSNFDVFDMDIILNNDDFQTACENWVKLAYFATKSGRGTILFGNAPKPYDVQACEYIKHFQEVHFLHLHCNDTIRRLRLDLRGWWPEEGILETLGLSAGMLERSKAAQPLIPIIDTSQTSVADVAAEIKRWVLSKWNKN